MNVEMVNETPIRFYRLFTVLNTSHVEEFFNFVRKILQNFFVSKETKKMRIWKFEKNSQKKWIIRNFNFSFLHF